MKAMALLPPVLAFVPFQHFPRDIRIFNGSALRKMKMALPF